MAAWATGIQLGPYVLLAQLGAGGMGEVWKARDTRLNRIVAVKRVKSRYTPRFEQEARAIAALNHPNICQIHDIGPDYLVLEYIEGAPLAGPLPIAQAVRLAKQIVAALDAAHHKGVVHRDLKPANIMVTLEGAVKLLDFGLAKRVAGTDETLTLEGTVMGTAAYMAPEQARGKPLDARSDIFSFGAVLYELVSGRRAFSGENAVSTMAAILHKEPPPIDAPPALQHVIKKCLMKSPGERFQSVAEIVAALENSTVEAAESRPSIAVLPFANMSGDKDNEYFSDGLAEEIINALAQNAGLKVIARTSAFAFRGKEQDIRKIAEALDVKTILEGSVRRAGNRIRVMAQLIKAEDGSHLWSQRYDREMADIFELQDEVAQAIASALQVKLSGAPAPLHQYKPNLAAYEALLKARYLISRVEPDLLPRIKEAFELAIELDPNFAQAHAEFGEHFWVMAVSGALAPDQAFHAIREHATRALELDPTIAEGHAMLGLRAALYDYDWREAEKRFRLATAHEPVPPLVQYSLALYLVATDRASEAIQRLDLALRQDPLNFAIRAWRPLSFVAAGRDEDAAREAREMLDLNAGSYHPYLLLAWYHLLQGETSKALPLLEKAYVLVPSFPSTIGLLAAALHLSGDAHRAEDILQKLPADALGGPRARAAFYRICGDIDATAEWLEKAIEQRDPIAAYMPRSWYGRQLRGTPHWARLMRKLNLPEN
jgi:TolB-like protein